MTAKDLRGIIMNIANIDFVQEWSDRDGIQESDIQTNDDENNDVHDEF